jgi:prophage regulatory protein
MARIFASADSAHSCGHPGVNRIYLELTMAEQTNAAPRIIRREEVKHMTGLPFSSLYERVKAGTFPAPIRLGAGAKAAGWVEAEVIAWIAEQINNRDRVVA